ncbi:MAG: hypothetical protein AAFV32_09910 [Myxococcota bacterium]
MQYTLRNVPDAVDAKLRELAQREGRSLNEVAIEALTRAVGLTEQPSKQRDLCDIAGSWIADDAVDSALEDQRRIDDALWR